MFDITLGGTKNWQGGLNAKEPVYLTACASFLDAFACNAFVCNAFVCNASQCCLLCVCCSPSLSRCMPMTRNQNCAFTSSFMTTQSTAKQIKITEDRWYLQPKAIRGSKPLQYTNEYDSLISFADAY